MCNYLLACCLHVCIILLIVLSLGQQYNHLYSFSVCSLSWPIFCHHSFVILSSLSIWFICFQKHLIIKIVQQLDCLKSQASRKCYIQVEEVQATPWWFCNVHCDIWQSLALWAIVSESISSCHWILLTTITSMITLSDIFPIHFPDLDLKVLSGHFNWDHNLHAYCDFHCSR